VLILDTDEKITKEFIEYHREKIDFYQKEAVNGVWVPRLNDILGKPLNYSSEWLVYQLRLMRKKVKFPNTIYKFCPDLKNIRWIQKDKSIAIKHYGLENIESFIQIKNIYSSIESKNIEKNSNSIMHVFFALKDFVARYIKMKGFLDGKRGLH
tara:strand:+ start:844 stop:1302 length:459 start_codon:yes stop_codon:yes gene_type:complete